MGGGGRTLKDFAENDEEDWGDLAVQLSPKGSKKTTRHNTGEEEEWEKSVRGSRAGSTSRSHADSTPRKEETNRSRRPSDSKNELSKYTEDDDEDWGDLAAQLSPRGKVGQKKLQDFAETDDDDWGDLGEQLSAKRPASDIKVTANKLDKFAENDDDDDWNDLAQQFSNDSSRTSGKTPRATNPSIKLDVEEDDENWGDLAQKSETTSLSTSSSRSHRMPDGTDDDFGDLAGDDGEVDLAAKLALTRKARLEGQSSHSVPTTMSEGEEDPFADEDDPFGDDFDWSDNESGPYARFIQRLGCC